MRRNIFAALFLAASCSAFAQAEYQVVVTTTDGEQKVFAASDVASVKFENAPHYMDCTEMVSAIYQPASSYGLYTVTFGDCGADADGCPVEVGGIQATLTFVGGLSEDVGHPVLPAGYYRAAAGTSAGHYTWDLQKSVLWLRYGEGEDEVVRYFLVGNDIDVRSTEDGRYDIRADLSAFDGSQVALRYQGELDIIPGSLAGGIFTEDQDIVFEGGQGRYWGNWFMPFADDMSLQFYTGTFDENGIQTEGYWMYMPCYIPKQDNPKEFNPVRLTDGTYIMEWREEVSGSTYLPFTFERGRTIDMWGTEAPAGTYLMHTAADGSHRMAYITGGTFTVSGGGTRFEFDFETENDIRIHGVYDKAPYVSNLCDNDFPGLETVDSLEGDVELDFTPRTFCADYVMGDIIAEGVDMHSLVLMDASGERGDYIWIDLCSPGNRIAAGTYTLNDRFEEFGALKGRVDFGMQPQYSWYGDLGAVEQDPDTGEWYHTKMCPLAGGTVTVAYEGDETVLTFDLKSAGGHSITGVWRGFMIPVLPDDAEPAKYRSRMTPRPRASFGHAVPELTDWNNRLLVR